ncbi:hypothetical protein VP01_277g7 [Puccinia sorghi]|uniref:Uncharacterized protein n=1 Tax=Puccinia sorghi TaxID=27349 RepID=A0A0L6V3F9_9BASI|nr:hypothetical protein VP01_277g7 [Puccinia sorghi]
MLPLNLKPNHKSPQLLPKKNGKKNSKNPPTCSQLTLGPSSSQLIDLTQDLDKGNTKLKHKCQRRDPESYNVKNFFSGPYHCKGYVPFNFLTKEMESDGPTGAFVLANYYETNTDLKKNYSAGTQDEDF